MAKLRMFRDSTEQLENDYIEVMSDPEIQEQYKPWRNHPLTQALILKLQHDYAAHIEDYFGEQKELKEVILNRNVALYIEGLVYFMDHQMLDDDNDDNKEEEN